MPLVVELPDAAPKLKMKYQSQLETDQMFNFGLVTGDFFSTGSAETDLFVPSAPGEPVVKHFQSMTINVGHTVKPSAKCKGMYILIEGDLIVNGTLSMTGLGYPGPGKYVGIDPRSELIYFDDLNIFSTDPNVFVLEKEGGVGGASVSIAKKGEFAQGGVHGSVGLTKVRGSGGGGAGGAHVINLSNTITLTAKSGAGAAGTVFCGGSGGGGASGRGANSTAPAGSIEGGIGGAGSAKIGAFRGRAGATGGAGGAGAGAAQYVKYSDDGSVVFNTGYGNGAGGLMILIVKGNVIINSTGKIVANGIQAPGVSAANTAVVGTGGGSGGGIIMLFHKQNISNLGSIEVNGGLGGARPSGYYAGGAGGAGHKELIPF